MSDLLSPFLALPAYGIGGLAIVLLYALQSEIRFGARARTIRRAGDHDVLAREGDLLPLEVGLDADEDLGIEFLRVERVRELDSPLVS